MEERIVRSCACGMTPPAMIENVPAMVCISCGEELFSDETAEVFERIRARRVGQYKMATMLVYDYQRALRNEPPAIGHAVNASVFVNSLMGMAPTYATIVVQSGLVLGPNIASQRKEAWAEHKKTA